MDFKDYQKASSKHLYTCLSIINSIEIFNSLKNNDALIVSDSKSQSVLHNVFYLSGYTLESIVNYSIFKHFKWKNASIYDLDHQFSNRCDVAFSPGIARKFGTGTYQFVLSKHEFQRNIQILTKAFPGSGIPFIDQSFKVDPEVVKLFSNWAVEMRYHPEFTKYAGIELNKENVTKFVSITETVYNRLMKIVG